MTFISICAIASYYDLKWPEQKTRYNLLSLKNDSIKNLRPHIFEIPKREKLRTIRMMDDMDNMNGAMDHNMHNRKAKILYTENNLM